MHKDRLALRIIKLFLIINCTLWCTNICDARQLKEARLETSVGTFIIGGKVAKEAGYGMLVSYPEYYISVQEGNNKIKLLIGDTSDFSSRLEKLYNESLIMRNKMGIFLGSFLQS